MKCCNQINFDKTWHASGSLNLCSFLPPPKPSSPLPLFLSSLPVFLLTYLLTYLFFLHLLPILFFFPMINMVPFELPPSLSPVPCVSHRHTCYPINSVIRCRSLVPCPFHFPPRSFHSRNSPTLPPTASSLTSSPLFSPLSPISPVFRAFYVTLKTSTFLLPKNLKFSDFLAIRTLLA